MSRLRSRKARRRARLLIQDETQESLAVKIMKYIILFCGMIMTVGLLFFGI